jgi:hypothetical protein
MGDEKCHKILKSRNYMELLVHGIPGCRWEDNSKMNLQEIRWEDMA